jgi:hypothetical protein
MGSSTLRWDEKLCLDAYLGKLHELTGHQWWVSSWLDAEFHTEQSPECVVTDGVDTQAVEVKGLYDDDSPSVFGNAEALKKRLKPRVEGHITIMLPSAYRGRRVPLALAGNVESEIERVAPVLERGKRGYIRVHQRSKLTRERSEHSHVFCDHGWPGHKGLDRLYGKVNGLFWLHDESSAGELHTDEALEDIERKVATACDELSRLGRNHTFVDWYEEWEIIRVKGSGVHVMTWSGGWEGPEAIKEPLIGVIQAGDAKFRERAWAPTRVLLIFDQFLGGANAVHLIEAMRYVDPQLCSNLDEIWALSSEDLIRLHKRH